MTTHQRAKLAIINIEALRTGRTYRLRRRFMVAHLFASGSAFEELI
jgi:hypothetical protein